MPIPSPARPCVLMSGLLVPLALAGAAAAQQGSPQGSPWVDPPVRPAVSEAVPSRAGAPRAGAVRMGAAKADVAKVDADGALPKASSTGAAGPGRALAARRPGDREADVPRPPAATPATVPEPSDRAAAARALTARYLATVSAPGAAMVGAAPRFYAQRVRFYGRPTTLAGLVAEKRGFVRRWPERRYEPRTIRTACDARTCTVRAVVDFRAASPGRGAVSSGAAELVLEVGFSGAHPVILAETGRVLRRAAQAAAPSASLAGSPASLVPRPGRA